MNSRLITLLMLLVLPAMVFAQSWHYTSSLIMDRWNSEMVTLDDNTALIVGGFHQVGGPLASCERYDPATAAWSLTGPLNVARSFPTLVKLANGHVLSMCGAVTFGGAASTNVVEDFNPSTNSWSIVGRLIVPRMVPTATLLSDGKILIAGGLADGGTTALCEVYDPTTNTSVRVGSMYQNRYCAMAVLMDDGKVMVAGGRDGGSSSNYFAECELYDPSVGIWSVLEPMHQARIAGILTKFSDNTVLAAAGRSTADSSATGSEVFLNSSLTWSPTDAIHEPVCWAGDILFPDDRFMTTGGIVNGGDWANSLGLADVSTSTCEWYDHSAQRWYYAPELNLSRCKHNAVYLHQSVNTDLPTDFLLVAGGKSGIVTTDSFSRSHIKYSFTGSCEILDVTPTALQTYMKLRVNAAVKQVTANSLDFRGYYLADGSIGIEYNSTEASEVEVMSADARVIYHYSELPFGAGRHSYRLSTRELSAGPYFLRFSSGGAHSMFKFIVAH